MLARKKLTMSKKEIRELMELKDWTQEQLARELLVTRQAVSLWASGERQVRGPALILLNMLLAKAREEASPAKQPA